MITDLGLNLMREYLLSQATFVAVGSDATAPTATDTQLGSEQFRKAITTAKDNGTGDAQTICYIAPGECNDFTIQELGLFTGGTVDQPNSGTLIARWLYNRAKTDLESIQITRDDVFSRG